MPFIIRPEAPEDYRAVELLVRDAFLPLQLPGRTRVDEHLLAHKLRESDAFVPELDYVAQEVSYGEDNKPQPGVLVGSILYSVSHIVNEEGRKWPVLTFGPLAVAPAWQGQGVGAALIRHTANEAKHLGCPAIVIYGHPGYYPRFGFVGGAQFDITAADGSSPDALLVFECWPGALQGISGRFLPDPVFNIDPAELVAFDVMLEQQLLGD